MNADFIGEIFNGDVFINGFDPASFVFWKGKSNLSLTLDLKESSSWRGALSRKIRVFYFNRLLKRDKN
jgi:hypothetical protein